MIAAYHKAVDQFGKMGIIPVYEENGVYNFYLYEERLEQGVEAPRAPDRVPTPRTPDRGPQAVMNSAWTVGGSERPMIRGIVPRDLDDADQFVH